MQLNNKGTRLQVQKGLSTPCPAVTFTVMQAMQLHYRLHHHPACVNPWTPCIFNWVKRERRCQTPLQMASLMKIKIMAIELQHVRFIYPT